MPGPTPAEIAGLLRMRPHPEGGWFVETYRAGGRIPRECAAAPHAGGRPFSTAIYYLLAGQDVSRLHRLVSDEVLHFYAGNDLEVLLLHPNGEGEVRRLGPDLAAGARPQLVVPTGTWFGFRIPDANGWALIGTTVAPAFEFDDLEFGDRTLANTYPHFADLIASLTPSPC